MGVLTNVSDIPRNITTIEGLFNYVVGVTPPFWPVILLITAVIIFAKTVENGPSRALIMSSLITGILGIGIATIGWMDPKWMYLFGVSLAGGFLWRYLESG